jgi:uncharacterized protein YbcC (UPF0753/DUF2309 family)
MTIAASSLTPTPSPHGAALATACASIAPTFPLDRFIAVNPYWGFVSKRIEVAAEQLGRLSGTSLLMKRSWFRQRWQRGEVTAAHLQTALKYSGSLATVEELLAYVDRDEVQQRTVSLMTHLADQGRDVGHHGSWSSFVTHTVSQVCASHFDVGQAAWTAKESAGLYRAWRTFASADRSPALLMGCDVRQLAEQLPASHHELVEEALRELEVPAARVTSYLSALLLDVNGWAAWGAYRRFQARLVGGDDEAIEELLAVRLAWELLLLRSGGGGEKASLGREWSAARLLLPLDDVAPPTTDERALGWVWQRATEVAFQEGLAAGLKSAVSKPETHSPTAQVVFCIDVRSEPFRRGLEAAGRGVQTLGFAGFFGLPIEYAPLGTRLVQAQLPGLLAARLRVTDVAASEDAAVTLQARREARLGAGHSWLGFQRASTSGFAFVEAMGLGYAWKLVQATLGLSAPVPSERVGLREAEQDELRPRLVSNTAGDQVSLAARVDLVHGILKASTLTGGFARLVVFAGHGSATTNNPHAAGLDCGACSGQSGAVNARVLAQLLNTPEVRQGLKDRGILIPDTTHFLGGMHNTTTDELKLYDLAEVPASHGSDVAELKRALVEAGNLTRAERAPTLGLQGDAASLLLAVKKRSCDWSEVRPEWGLVNNAAFIVAPRERTAPLRLDGRVFLHDYRHEADESFSVLELIMTAPMIVTHWINMQYYASTVDNQRYGSGNKVLHNVVGGSIGVFEGNGGDLRIGLPLQSIHDGQEFRHTPLRLSVFIAAPRHAIEGVIQKHALVRQLVENEWLHLFRLDDLTVEQRRSGEWHPV